MEFCARGGSAEKIANRYGVSHSNLYFWREKLFAGGCTDEMEKPEEPITEAALEALRAENAELAERVEALRRENQDCLRNTALQNQIPHNDEDNKNEEGNNANTDLHCGVTPLQQEIV